MERPHHRRLGTLSQHLTAAATPSATTTDLLPRFTDEQRRALYHNGFVIIRNAIPSPVLRRAKAIIEESIPPGSNQLLNPSGLVTHPAVVGLINDSNLSQ